MSCICVRRERARRVFLRVRNVTFLRLRDEPSAMYGLLLGGAAENSARGLIGVRIGVYTRILRKVTMARKNTKVQYYPLCFCFSAQKT